MRVYLTVDEDGKVSEKSEGGLWNEERTLLQILFTETPRQFLWQK